VYFHMKPEGDVAEINDTGMVSLLGEPTASYSMRSSSTTVKTPQEELLSPVNST
jgi:hypothetical protein